MTRCLLSAFNLCLAPRLDHKPLYYVLSAGRTGTIFLENLIGKHCPEVFIAHEPSPSRIIMMLGNLRNDFGVLNGAIRRIANCHQTTFHGREGQQIEVNPFLCSVTDLLPHATRPLRIVHMVREPGAWAQSITTFKASTRYRHLIDYVPFAKPFPAPRPNDWRNLSAFEQSLHRWNWCNQRIAELEAKANAYTRARSEDIFSGDPELRTESLDRIFGVLELPLRAKDLAKEEFSIRVNPSPSGLDLRDAVAERAICGMLASRFGYEI